MKNSNTILIFFVGIIGAALLSSCSEDVISVDLNDADPKIVIEGTVVEGAAIQTVTLTKTTDFFEPGEYPPVTGASATISDDAGNEAVLAETSPGLYQTSSIEGVVGRTYTLTVSNEGTTYTAVSAIHPQAAIDSLTYEVENDEEDMETYLINIYFKDTENRKEYYRFKVFINGVHHDGLYCYQDRLTDGNNIHYDIYLWQDEMDEDLHIGDSITVEMQSIDKQVYEYYSSLNDALTANASSGFIFSSVPDNPISNISTDVLGYFTAYASTADSVTVDTLKEKK